MRRPEKQMLSRHEQTKKNKRPSAKDIYVIEPEYRKPGWSLPRTDVSPNRRDGDQGDGQHKEQNEQFFAGGTAIGQDIA